MSRRRREDDAVITPLLLSRLLPLSAALALDTHHLESLSKSDTDDTFPEQGILGIDLIHHPALLQ